MPLYEGEDGSGGGAGGTGNAGTGQQSDGTGQQDLQKKSNGEDTVDVFANLWQDPVEDEKGGEKNKPQAPATTDEDGNKKFNDHLATLNFLDGVDLEKVSQDLQQGDTKSLQSVLTSQAQNVYKRALIDSNNLMDQKIGKAVADAVKQGRTASHGDMAVRLMEGTLSLQKIAHLTQLQKLFLAD